MDRETRKALKESIAHWYRISACETVDELISEGYNETSCSLCNLFYIPRVYTSACICVGCPVQEKTGEILCNLSPYVRASNSLEEWEMTGEWYNTDQDNIEAEIRFLESLLEG